MYIHKIVMDNKDIKALLYCIVGLMIISSRIPTIGYFGFIFIGYEMYICISKIKKLIDKQ